MLSRGTIIFGIILLTHFAIQYLVPKDWQITSYFIATLGPLIILLIAALSTQKQEFATWTILFLTTALAYVISNAILISFTNYVVKDTNIPSMLISQTIVIVLYIVSKIWLKFTDKLAFNNKIIWLMIVLIVIDSALGVLKLYFVKLNATSLVNIIMMFSFVIIFQAVAAVATKKWDNNNETPQTTIQ